MKWIRARLSTWIKVVHSPESAFGGDFSGPSYLIPWVFLSLTAVAVTVLQLPIQMDWMRHHFQSLGAAPDQIATNLQLFRNANRFLGIVVPTMLFIRWLALAVILWLVAQVMLECLTFQQSLSIVAYSYLPILLRDATICLVLHLRKEAVLYTADGLDVAIGLNLLFRNLPSPWRQLASNINMFEIWFLTLMILGISGMARASRRQAAIIVLPCWLFTAGVKFGLASLGLSYQKP